MPEDILYLGGDNAGALRAIREVVAEKRRLRGELASSRKASKGLTAELEKIPRRMIVAGGAALGLSAILGTVRGIFADWSQRIDGAREAMISLHQETRNYLGMIEGVETKPRQGLLKEAWDVPLTTKQVTDLREVSESLLPEGVGTAAQREKLARIGGAFQRVRGLEGMGMAVGKAKLVYRQESLAGISNVFDRLTKKAGFAGGEDIASMLEQMAKAVAAGRAAGMEKGGGDLAMTAALMEGMTRGAGSPEEAAQGVRMLYSRIFAPGFGQKLGMPKPVWQAKSDVERIRYLMGAGISYTRMQELVGKRPAERIQMMTQHPEIMAEILAAHPEYQELLRKRQAGILEQLELKRQGPAFRGAEEVLTATQRLDTMKQSPQYGLPGLYAKQRTLLTQQTYGPRPGLGWAERVGGLDWGAALVLAGGDYTKAMGIWYNRRSLQRLGERRGLELPALPEEGWPIGGISLPMEEALRLSEGEQRGPKRGQGPDTVNLVEEEKP